MKGVLVRWIPFLVAGLLFVFLPFRVGPAAMINIRLAVFLPLFVLCVLRPNPGASSRAPLLVAAALNVAVAANAALEIAACHRELGAFDTALERVTPGSRLLALHFDRRSEHSHFPPWIHIAALHRARLGGVASVSFAELAHWPVRYRAGRAPPTRPGHFWEFSPCSYRNAIDGPHYDHVLVRGDVDPFAGDPPGPRYRLDFTADRWTVYTRTGETAPGTADSDPGPCPEAPRP